MFGKPKPVTVYVRNDEVGLNLEHVTELSIRLAQDAVRHTNFTGNEIEPMPDYAFLNERQYRMLPAHLQAYFVPKSL